MWITFFDILKNVLDVTIFIEYNKEDVLLCDKIDLSRIRMYKKEVP